MQVIGQTDGGEPLIAVFMPSLISLLIAAERRAGRPLERAQVEAIRDEAIVVAIPQSAVAPIVEGRGYDDIDPERCYEEYLRVRAEVIDHDFTERG